MLGFHTMEPNCFRGYNVGMQCHVICLFTIDCGIVITRKRVVYFSCNYIPLVSCFPEGHIIIRYDQKFRLYILKGHW